MYPCHIVVVDDDDAIRSLVTKIAHEAVPSALVTDFASSLHALQEIESGSADLLITNFHMPDLDGVALVRRIRSSKNAIPIIMVSGSDEVRRLGEEAGIDCFVPKHAIQPALSEAIRSFIPAM